MKKNMKKCLYQADAQTNLEIDARALDYRMRFYAEELIEHPLFIAAILTGACLVDFISFVQLFNSFLWDRAILRYVLVISLVFSFDIATAYLGSALKRKRQGFQVDTVLLVLFSAAFLIGFLGNIWLRISLRDKVLPSESAFATQMMGAISQEQPVNELAMPYAVFSCMLPLITSMVSAGVSYMATNPLKQKMKRQTERKICLDTQIAKIEAVLKEYEADAGFKDRLLSEDETKYRNMLDDIDERSLYYADYVRERIKEHVGEAAATNELSKDKHAQIISFLQRTAV